MRIEYQFRVNGVDQPPSPNPTQTFPMTGIAEVYVRAVHRHGNGQDFPGQYTGPIVAETDASQQ